MHKALVLESFDKPITIKELPTPNVTPGSVLVSPLYTGLKCYSRAISKGNLPYPLTLPLTPGNFCIACVEIVGPDATFIKPDDVVWLDPTIAVRDDPDMQHLFAFHAGITPASQKLMADVWRNGCYVEKTPAPLESVFPFPDSIFK